MDKLKQYLIKKLGGISKEMHENKVKLCRDQRDRYEGHIRKMVVFPQDEDAASLIRYYFNLFK